MFAFSKFLRRHSNGWMNAKRPSRILKSILPRLPLLNPSIQGEKLYLYLVMSLHAISSALIREEGKVQKPVYYASQALRGAKTIFDDGKVGFCINNGF